MRSRWGEVRIANYSRVRLQVDTYLEEGVGSGAHGYVIEVWPDGKYEVEFSDSEGITIARLVLAESEIERLAAN